LRWKNTVLIKYRGLRRALGALLVGAGALLMWLAPEVWWGVVLLVAGIALEAAGITLEHRSGRPRENSRAVER
jgi:drug/metabolite transporter (DMT)-like permease